VVTDDDAICPNQEAHRKLLEAFDRVLRVYTRPGCQYPVVSGAKPFVPRELALLDLLSAADLAAGAIERCLPLEGCRPDSDTLVKAGADKVLQWLARDQTLLKKLIVMVRRGEGIGTEAGVVEFG
jgi:hypothetical protein